MAPLVAGTHRTFRMQGAALLKRRIHLSYAETLDVCNSFAKLHAAVSKYDSAFPDEIGDLGLGEIDSNPIAEVSQKLKTHLGSIKSACHNYFCFLVAQRDFEESYGKDALVRIKRDWVFQARDGQGLSFREFSVLCGIYSAIGNKKVPVRITLEMIRSRAMGCKSLAILPKHYGANPRKSDCLTRRQIDITTRKLHSLGFFSRATYGRRVTYYSNRLTDAQLRAAIKKRFTYEPTFKSEMSAKDETMSEEIRRLKAEAKNA